MSQKVELPIILYDNQCYLCVKFAKIVNFLARSKFSMIGHYSIKGEKIREEILDKSALDMFWLIEDKVAYGGRAALLPLIKTIFFSKRRNTGKIKINPASELYCKNGKAVFLRSASLICNSKKITYESNLNDV